MSDPGSDPASSKDKPPPTAAPSPAKGDLGSDPATSKDKPSPAATPPAIASSEADPSARFRVVNDTQEKEDAFDLVRERNLQQPTGLLGTIAYIIKGALGAGILGSHAGFANGGAIALIVTPIVGIYMGCCLIVLVTSAQVIYKRTTLTKMSYSDVGEAAFATSNSMKIRKLKNVIRYFTDTVVCIDLFGSCCCYQLMISGTIKQIVEGSQNTSVAGLTPSHPNLKHYMLMLMVPMIMICLIKRLDILAKFSIVGNFLIVLCVIATVYYSLKVNPTMRGMKFFTNARGFFTFIGMTAFSMSCSGIVVSLECNMSKPHQFPLAMSIGMAVIIIFVCTLAIFGYSAWGEASKAPVTFHFPMTTFPIILKVSIALMLVITHAVNFWVPFNMLYHYIRKCIKEQNQNKYEYGFRALICAIITMVGIIFPSVSKLMSFIGAFCITNMAFILPTIIWLTVSWERPGLGTAKWRLIMGCVIIFFALIIFTAGTFVSVKGLIEIFSAPDEKIDTDDDVKLDLENYDNDVES